MLNINKIDGKSVQKLHSNHKWNILLLLKFSNRENEKTQKF